MSSKEITFYVVVGNDPLDGIYVSAIFKSWNKAAMYVNGKEEWRIREVNTLEESL